MANIVCDICGGNIKMQANRTGVCQNCGMEYDIEAIRAMAANGASTPTASPVRTAASPANDNEVSREALLIYLDDVRVLETILKKTSGFKSIISAKAEKLTNAIKATVSEMKPLLNSKDINIEYKYKDYKSSLDEDRDSIPQGIGFIIAGPMILALIIMIIPSLSLLGILACIFFVPLGLLEIIAEIKSRHDKAYERYEDQLNSLNNRVKTFNMHNNNLNKKLKTLKSEYKEIEPAIINNLPELEEEEEIIKNNLTKAYSANIIPMQFRNIEGVYYLYDYLSTSNQSLSEALMQANLEAIKQKLDKVIEQQGTQIVLQAQANAKLDDIRRKNQEILETAQATMNNTAVAAKYAQIAAVNSEITAQLSAKQLAYQKAEFWLNEL